MIKRFILLSAVLLIFPSVSLAEKVIPVIQLKDYTINPVTSEYITNAIDKAEELKAPCLIIKLDTPGGLLNSTRSIVKRMLTSKVPLVVYISPSGAHAGSAGVFITYASHIAAMAPTTNIGAAHPIQYGKQKPQETQKWDELQDILKQIQEVKNIEPKKSEKQSDEKGPNEEEVKLVPDADALESKLLNDTVAFIKAIAEERNRNVDWAVKSVVESESITDTEALEKQVIDLIAKDDQELIEKLDGRMVKVNDQEIVIETKGARLDYIEMNQRQKLFNIIASPDIAYFLLIIGFYGLLYEITHPGAIIPGVFGAISMILALYSMQTMPINYAGLSLVFIGLSLLVAEIFAPGIGALAFGGIISLVIGSFLLFDTVDPVMRVSLPSIGGIAITAGVLSLILVNLVVKSRLAKVVSGKEALIGDIGIVDKPIKPGSKGKFDVQGELWNAISDEELKKGDKAKVVKVDGLTLHIEKVKGG